MERQVRNSNHAGNGNGPALQVDRWNSLSTLKFDGISNYLKVDNSSVFDIGVDGTIFIVCQGHDTQDWRPALSKNGETAGWQFKSLIQILARLQSVELLMQIHEAVDLFLMGNTEFGP